jgi:hypothetical protein
VQGLTRIISGAWQCAAFGDIGRLRVVSFSYMKAANQRKPAVIETASGSVSFPILKTTTLGLFFTHLQRGGLMARHFRFSPDLAGRYGMTKLRRLL